MILMNINGKDSIDIEKVFLVLSDYDINPAKNNNRFISLSRTEKTRSYLITKDYFVYAISLNPTAFINKYYKTYYEYGMPSNISIKISSNDYFIGVANIILITDSLSRIMEKEYKRLDVANRIISPNGKKTKTYIFVKGEEDSFLIKTNLARSTIITHIRDAIRKN